MSLEERLRAAPKFGDGVGLKRMAYALERLDVAAWLGNLDAVKITGSNGKGTCAHLTAATLAELAVSAGLFTSPHLLRITERVRLGSQDVASGDLLEAWEAAEKIAEGWQRKTGERFGGFELLTVAALRVFAGEAGDSAQRPRRVPGEGRVETVVAEAGIGGRYDSTRAIPGRIVGITSLDLEHSNLLGDTLEEIADHKADLCPDGGLLVLGADIDGPLLESMKARARSRGVEVLATSERARVLDIRYDGGRMRFDMELRGTAVDDVAMAMAGRHQWSNAVVAFLLVEAWAGRHRPQLGFSELLEAWRRALAKTALPGRFEEVRDRGGAPVFIDYCHTPRAAAVLAETASTALAGRRIVLILGVSEGKDAASIAAPLLPLADLVILTRAGHRGADPGALAGFVERSFPELDCRRTESVHEAVSLARALARVPRSTVLVAGGLFLGVECAEVLAGRDPAALRFF